MKKILIGLFILSNLAYSNEYVEKHIRTKIEFNYKVTQMTIEQKSDYYVVTFKDRGTITKEYYHDYVIFKHERYIDDKLIYMCEFDALGRDIINEIYY